MQNQVDTLIPILYTRHGTLEGAVAEALEMINVSIANFEVAAQQLLERYHSNKELHSNLQKWLHACRCACTSNLNWRLVAWTPILVNRESAYLIPTVSVQDDISLVRSH